MPKKNLVENRLLPFNLLNGGGGVLKGVHLVISIYDQHSVKVALFIRGMEGLNYNMSFMYGIPYVFGYASTYITITTQLVGLY